MNTLENSYERSCGRCVALFHFGKLVKWFSSKGEKEMGEGAEEGAEEEEINKSQKDLSKRVEIESVLIIYSDGIFPALTQLRFLLFNTMMASILNLNQKTGAAIIKRSSQGLFKVSAILNIIFDKL